MKQKQKKKKKETERQLFEKINKIDKFLASLIRKWRRNKLIISGKTDGYYYRSTDIKGQ